MHPKLFAYKYRWTDLFWDCKNLPVISNNPNNLRWHIMFLQAIHKERPRVGLSDSGGHLLVLKWCHKFPLTWVAINIHRWSVMLLIITPTSDDGKQSVSSLRAFLSQLLVLARWVCTISAHSPFPGHPDTLFDPQVCQAHSCFWAITSVISSFWKTPF